MRRDGFTVVMLGYGCQMATSRLLIGRRTSSSWHKESMSQRRRLRMSSTNHLLSVNHLCMAIHIKHILLQLWYPMKNQFVLGPRQTCRMLPTVQCRRFAIVTSSNMQSSWKYYDCQRQMDCTGLKRSKQYIWIQIYSLPRVVW